MLIQESGRRMGVWHLIWIADDEGMGAGVGWEGAIEVGVGLESDDRSTGEVRIKSEGFKVGNDIDRSADGSRAGEVASCVGDVSDRCVVAAR